MLIAEHSKDCFLLNLIIRLALISAYLIKTSGGDHSMNFYRR